MVSALLEASVTPGAQLLRQLGLWLAAINVHIHDINTANNRQPPATKEMHSNFTTKVSFSTQKH